jgi:hypothetical protein
MTNPSIINQPVEWNEAGGQKAIEPTLRNTLFPEHAD